MNPNEFEKIWALLKSGEFAGIDPASAEAFDRHLDANQELLSHVADEQIIDALLRFEAFREKNNDSFVENCVRAIREDMARPSAVSTTTHDLITESDLVDQDIPDTLGSTGNQVHASRQLHIPGPFAGPVDDAPVARFAGIVTDNVLEGTATALPEQDGKRLPRMTRAFAVVAAVAAALLMTVGTAVWFGTGNPQTEISENGPASAGDAQNERRSNESSLAGTTGDTEPTIENEALENVAISEEDIQRDDDPGPESEQVVEQQRRQESTGDGPQSNLPGDQVVAQEAPAVPQHQPSPGEEYTPESTTETYASITILDETDEAVSPDIGRVGNQLVEFTSGRGAVEFDNGVVIKFLAPASMKVLSGNSIELVEGNFQSEIPREVELFEMLTPGNRWVCSGRTNSQIHFHPTGTIEGYVFRGDMDVQPLANEQPAPTTTADSNFVATNGIIELDDNGLNQILIHPGRDSIPSITMAMGDRRQFLGQIGVDGRTWQTPSADQFIEAANTVLNEGSPEDQTASSANEQFDRWQGLMREFETNLPGSSQQVADLNNLMNQIINGQNGGGQSNGSSTFDGMIDANGRQQRFNSQEEFERARQQADLPVRPNNAPFQNAQQFEGVININGNAFRFSTPAEFKQFQRMMRN
ncbi:MAG: hypothetical protein AAF456_05660 [Planctomycetota bacterium]